MCLTWKYFHVMHVLSIKDYFTGDPLHSRAACTQPCNVNTHSRAHCSPGARLCEQWGHGCVNNGARLCASARLCRGSPVYLSRNNNSRTQILPHTAAVLHWPVGNLHIKQISALYGQILNTQNPHSPNPTPTPDIGIELYMVKYYTARPPRWFSLFDVFHVPHSAVKCIHSSVAGWG